RAPQRLVRSHAPVIAVGHVGPPGACLTRSRGHASPDGGRWRQRPHSFVVVGADGRKSIPLRYGVRGPAAAVPATARAVFPATARAAFPATASAAFPATPHACSRAATSAVTSFVIVRPDPQANDWIFGPRSLLVKYSNEYLTNDRARTNHGGMTDRAAKDALFDGFAEVAKALASGRQAEIADLLAQGARPVEEIAADLGHSPANP